MSGTVRYPQKNRPATYGEILDIHIEHAGGVFLTNPNEALKHVYNQTLQLAAPLCDLKSDIDSSPAYRYFAHDVSIALNEEQLHRLIQRRLQPEEFFILAEKYGIFHEINGALYDEETGNALQPMD